MRLSSTRAPAPGLGADRGGAAYVEFLLSFIPLFVMFMGMAQMALMYAGDLVVQHAATRAARAAVVVLDDDPRRYEDAPRRRVDTEGRMSSEDALGGILDIFGGEMPSMPQQAPGGPRIDAIRRAASMPLMAISPSFSQLSGADTLGSAMDSPESRGATGALVYNAAALGVTFPQGPGSTSYRTSFGSRGDDVQVTTRVTYLFHCGVPLANRLMCQTYPELRLGPAATMISSVLRQVRNGELSLGDAMRELDRIDTTRRRHERDEPAMQELESAANNDLMYLTGIRGARFKVMRAEATMPLQYAGYRFPGE